MIDITRVKNPEELNALEDKTAISGSLTFEFSLEYLEKLRTLANSSYQFIAKIDSAFAGYICAIDSNHFPDHLEIIELFVDPSHQRKGVGSILMQKIEEVCKNSNNLGLIVQTENNNLPAIAFYTAKKFSQIENPGWSGVTFSKKCKEGDENK